jgi:hypothetical protein
MKHWLPFPPRGQPEVHATDLCGEPLSLLVFACVCPCRCPAILATTATGIPVPPAEGGEAVD